MFSLLVEARDLMTGPRRLTARLRWEAMADMFSVNMTMKLTGKIHLANIAHCIVVCREIFINKNDFWLTKF